MGFDSHLVDWFLSFLTNRTQRVKINGIVSDPIAVGSGVPQGSHCGPVLFVLFINDVEKIFKFCDILLYADDLKLFRIVDNLHDCDLVQQDINNLCSWCVTNELGLNANKCQIMSFTRRRNKIVYDYELLGDILKRVTSVSDLCVIFDESLSFKKHISNISCKAMRAWGMVCTIARDFSIDTVLKLYCALVRCHLEYACTVWNPYLQIGIDMLEPIQKKFLRHVEFRLGQRHVQGIYCNVMDHLSLRTLSCRRNFSDLICLYKMIHNKLDWPSLLSALSLETGPNRGRTRSKFLFAVPKRNANYSFNFSLDRMMRSANSLNRYEWFDIFGNSVGVFKRGLFNNMH